jgi:hypothetical protein
VALSSIEGLFFDRSAFVNIRLIEGRSQQRKDEISKRVTDAISEVLQGARWV